MSEVPDYRATTWWPSSVGDQNDLPPFPGYKWQHIEQHLVPNVGNNKTSFPAPWSYSQIGLATALLLRRIATQYGIPAVELWPGPFEGLVQVASRRAFLRVWLQIDIDNITTIIGTVHPLRGDDVYHRLGGKLVARPLNPDEE